MSWTAYLTAIFLFLLLIVSHEFGHYAAAKLCGVRVNEFSVGMGPLIWHKIKGDTEYSLRAFPIGGFCRLEGEDGESEDAGSFGRAGALKKTLILAAGAFMNIALALLIMTALYTWIGEAGNTVGGLVEGKPAYEAGVLSGDRIVSVNGIETYEWQEIVSNIDSSGEELTLTVERGSEILSFEVPTYKSADGRNVIGISPRIRHNVLNSFVYSLRVTGDFMLSMRDFFVHLFTGRVSSDEVVGVVGMVSMIGDSARAGISSVIFLMCIISLNLGVVNLLPLPALDGGRILFVIIRAAARGRISDKAESYVHGIGMVLLMALMVFLIFNDTLRIIRG